MLHFLADISCDSWNSHIGSYILLSFGPESAAKLQPSLAQPRPASQHAQSQGV